MEPRPFILSAVIKELKEKQLPQSKFNENFIPDLELKKEES